MSNFRALILTANEFEDMELFFRSPKSTQIYALVDC
jgi:hypothetical protein